MPGVRIVTDSACDLSEEELAEHGIEVVPLSIRFGDREYVDRQDLSPEEFYRLLAEHEELPETAAPAPGAFEQAFRKLTGEGADAIVCIDLSLKLSATGLAAQNAARAVEGEIDVRVVDSRSITAGLGTLVLLAADAARKGAGPDEIVAMVNDKSDRTHVYGVLDTLENLKKGGRIGSARALLGSMLSIKPILDLSSGEVVEAGKQRTRRRALEWLRDKMAEFETLDDVAVLHGAAEDIDDFLDMIDPIVPRDQIRISLIGPVIGTHGGPGVIGVTFTTD